MSPQSFFGIDIPLENCRVIVNIKAFDKEGLVELIQGRVFNIDFFNKEFPTVIFSNVNLGDLFWMLHLLSLRIEKNYALHFYTEQKEESLNIRISGRMI